MLRLKQIRASQTGVKVDRVWRKGGNGEKKEKGRRGRKRKKRKGGGKKRGERGEKESEQNVASQDWLTTLSRLEEAKRGRAGPAEHADRGTGEKALASARRWGRRGPRWPQDRWML